MKEMDAPCQDYVTVPQLFIKQERKGNKECYYCGHKCDEENIAKDFVKITFNNRDIIARPAGGFVCHGCAMVMSSDQTITMIDGEIREHQKIRSYSWVLTKEKNLAATKAHIGLLRSIILAPPEPPFAIILSNSGQKQLMFRAKIAFERDNYPLTLEEEIIAVNIGELIERIILAEMIIKVLGKQGALSVNIKEIITLSDCYDEAIWKKWIALINEPITRLATWISRPKKELNNENIKS
jgi:CRISPR type IV-associated protein Csf1